MDMLELQTEAGMHAFASPQGQPVLGVVIPAYGHPQFLTEAIDCVLRQDIEETIALVIVDDGCRFNSTAQAARPELWVRGGGVHYLRQRNRGLSAARNSGVDYLLACYPQMQAIFFLDADNRLEDYALRSYWKRLCEHPQAGWCYPDIFLFGMVGDADGVCYHQAAPEYSVLTHLVDNICEAGSLVRTDLFRQGVRFDESMRSGYEDWDFWLQAISAGYRGVGVRDSGFMYRRRPESMVAESNRKRSELLAYLQRKHKTLYESRALARLEQAENPRFALIHTDRDEVLLTSDIACPGKRVSREAFSHQLSDWKQRPEEHFFPSVLLVISEGSRCIFAETNPYARWLLWLISDNKQAPVAFASTKVHGNPEAARVWAISSELIRLGSEDAIDLPPHVVVLPELASCRSPKSDHQDIGRQDAKALLRRIVSLEAREPLPATGRHYSGPSKSSVRSILHQRLELQRSTLPLVLPNLGRASAVLLAAPADLATVPGSAIQRLAESLARLGCRVSLLGFSAGSGVISKPLPPIFENLIPFEHQPTAAKIRYLGRPLDQIDFAQARDELLSLAAPFEMLIAMDVPWLASIFGQLRGLGLVCASVVDCKTVDDSEEGHMLRGMMVAFEHSHDAFLCEDDGAVIALSAEGIPAEKLLRLEDRHLLRLLGSGRRN